MRKFVTSIVFLSALVFTSACGGANQGGKSVTTADSTSKKREVKPAANKPESQDSEASADSLYFEDDSLYTYDEEEEYDSLDAYDYELDTEVDPEWFEEDSIMEDEESYRGNIRYAQGDLILESEKLISTEVINVVSPDFMDTRDSVLAIIEERMALGNEKISKRVVVEKWRSPVNYKGYKFNRKKLMLYGVGRESRVSVFYYLDNYYLGFNKRLYDLEETTSNTAFRLIADTALTRHLLQYENTL